MRRKGFRWLADRLVYLQRSVQTAWCLHERDVPTDSEAATEPRNDIALIEAYRAGDLTAFDELFRRYHGRVRAICLRYTGDEMVAEDLVQETFVNVLRSLGRVDATFNFGGWISRIAVNICQDELRRRNRRAVHQETGGDPEDHLLHVADTDATGDPERALEISHLRQLVWDVAKKLPERQRMVLTLRELQGLSYASIAHVMGISDAAVETLLHRARKRFKEEYLLLDSPTEGQGPCAQVAHLLETVGRPNLRPKQRKFVAEHIGSCDWCQEHYLPSTSPVAEAVPVRAG